MTTSETTHRAGDGAEPAGAPPPNAASLDKTVPLAFLARLRDGDFEAIEELLAPDVWLRSLLVRKVHESNTAAEAVAALRSWVGSPHGAEVIETDHHPMAGREFIRYRVLVRPTWAPDRVHVLEQVGYCRVKEGLITRLDLVCTGYHAVDEPPAAAVYAGRSPNDTRSTS